MNESNISTNPDSCRLRVAVPEDVPVILAFIKELAVYEKMLDQVAATEGILNDSLFVKKAAKALIVEYGGKPVGYAIFFYNFSTFTGKPGIYLEDIYVTPAMRGKGFGKSVFRWLANHAKEQGCARMEWSCLDWNEPSRKFYRGLGAVSMDDWTVFRLTEKEIDLLAAGE